MGNEFNRTANGRKLSGDVFNVGLKLARRIKQRKQRSSSSRLSWRNSYCCRHLVRGLRLAGKLASGISSTSDPESASGSESVVMTSVSAVCSASERASSGVGPREFNLDGCRESDKISRAGNVSAVAWSLGKFSD